MDCIGPMTIMTMDIHDCLGLKPTIIDLESSWLLQHVVIVHACKILQQAMQEPSKELVIARTCGHPGMNKICVDGAGFFLTRIQSTIIYCVLSEVVKKNM